MVLYSYKTLCAAQVAVEWAVGITAAAPHRSVRAIFPHTALQQVFGGVQMSADMWERNSFIPLALEFVPVPLVSLTPSCLHLVHC